MDLPAPRSAAKQTAVERDHDCLTAKLFCLLQCHGLMPLLLKAVNSQSTGTKPLQVHTKERGYGAGKNEHIAANADGRQLLIRLTPVNISDSADGPMILDAICNHWY